MTRSVTAPELKRMLRDDKELALLDVREEGRFAAGHLLLAVPMPLSQLELRVRDLVPRWATRIVLLDDADGLSARAAEGLEGFGYTDVALLEGGLPAWKVAGYQLFSGMNVPSKAFGEFVEHTYGTPSVTPEELKALLESKRDLVILDSRPMEEYSVMNIPGGVDVPGAELVYRVHDIAPDPETLVVVNCAGRTRSIIGAQSLINAGIRNKVVALRNGTMGWHLAGLELERGKRRAAPLPTSKGVETAKAAAERVGRRFGVRSVNQETLRTWQAEAEHRTLYLLDVRGPDEYEAGHMPGSRNAPGGQLVQATDTYIGTRNARVVLVDDTGVRATMTASWLIQMGWAEVYVLDGGLLPFGLEQGPHRPEVPGLDGADHEIGVDELASRLGSPTPPVVIDLARSPAYKRGHIPGAWFAIRSELPAALERAGSPAAVVLTSADGLLARLAVPEARTAGVADVAVLQGGTGAWRAAGRPLVEGAEHMASETLDVFPKPYERDGGIEAAMKEYLTWEVDLVNQLQADGDVHFKPYE
ncbi:MAG TPA: rhodanese-like domain-containing protein [bacterium]|nr:rhodanese-like domain-containing protein [bacterium]